MRILLLCTICFSLLFLSACNPQKHYVRKNNRKIERRADRRSGGIYTQYTADRYISRYRGAAVKNMKHTGIPASITLAQALLESGNGNSALARYANNHFGIKCTPDWNGRKYYRDDDRRNDCFRVYKKAGASFRDHALFLQRPRYSALFALDKRDYKGWAYGLKQAGYATNPDYPELLITLIERHQLYRYDRKRSRKQALREQQQVRDPKPRKTMPARTPAASSGEAVYTVRAGDTLYGIATRHGMSVEELMRVNNLKSTVIHPGMKLQLGKQH